VYVISIILPLKSRQPLTNETWVGSEGSIFEIYRGQYGIGKVFLRVILFSTFSAILRVLNTHVLSSCRSCYKDERANPGSQYIKQMLFQKSVALEIKVQLPCTFKLIILFACSCS